MTQWMIINQLEGTAVWFNLTDCPFNFVSWDESSLHGYEYLGWITFFPSRASYGNRDFFLSLEQLWNNQEREGPTKDWKHKTHRNRTNTTQHLTHSDKAGASSDQLQWMKQAHVYEEGATRQRARQKVVLARHEAKQICSLDGRLILILRLRLGVVLVLRWQKKMVQKLKKGCMTWIEACWMTSKEFEWYEGRFREIEERLRKKWLCELLRPW